jgi:hypothetical protein
VADPGGLELGLALWLQLLDKLGELVHALGLLDLLQDGVQLVDLFHLTLFLSPGVPKVVQHLLFQVAHFLYLPVSVLDNRHVFLHQFLLAAAYRRLLLRDLY